MLVAGPSSLDCGVKAYWLYPLRVSKCKCAAVGWTYWILYFSLRLSCVCFLRCFWVHCWQWTETSELLTSFLYCHPKFCNALSDDIKFCFQGLWLDFFLYSSTFLLFYLFIWLYLLFLLFLFSEMFRVFCYFLYIMHFHKFWNILGFLSLCCVSPYLGCPIFSHFWYLFWFDFVVII